MSDDRYTVVFNGDIREMGKNLFKVISPFGEVVACGVGNEFARADDLAERLDAFEMDGASAAHEITRLRADIAHLVEANAIERKRADKAIVERDALRAELAAVREKAFTAMRVFERYRELEAQVAAVEAERDALRGLLREAREWLFFTCEDDSFDLYVRIDALLNKGVGDAP